MIWKILLTAGLLLVAYLTLKSRLRGALTAEARDAPSDRWPRLALVKALALAVLGVMALGSLWYLWQDWEHGNRIVNVQVVNASTGAVVPYRARRRDIEGRTVRTLDGREIRLADVERMIVTERDPGP